MALCLHLEKMGMSYQEAEKDRAREKCTPKAGAVCVCVPCMYTYMHVRVCVCMYACVCTCTCMRVSVCCFNPIQEI